MTVFDLDTPHLNSGSRSEFSGATKPNSSWSQTQLTRPIVALVEAGRGSRHLGLAEVARRRVAGAGEAAELPERPMRRRRRGKAVAVSHDLQRAGVVLYGTHGKSAAADHLGAAVVPEPALEGLHIYEAREALVRGAAHPLAVSLHQFSQCIYSLQIRRGGVPSPEASAPTRFCVQG